MNTPPLSIFDTPATRGGAMFQRPGKGTRTIVNSLGSAISAPSSAASFNHPWKPALGPSGVILQKGTVQMASGIYEPVIQGVPISGPPPTPQPALFLDPTIPGPAGMVSYVCLQITLLPQATGSVAPAALAKDQVPQIVHLLNPVSLDPTNALCALATVVWQQGVPFQVLEGCYFNLIYTRIIPAPGGGPVQHFFT